MYSSKKMHLFKALTIKYKRKPVDVGDYVWVVKFSEDAHGLRKYNIVQAVIVERTPFCMSQGIHTSIMVMTSPPSVHREDDEGAPRRYYPTWDDARAAVLEDINSRIQRKRDDILELHRAMQRWDKKENTAKPIHFSIEG